MLVESTHTILINEFNPRDGHTHLYRLNNGIDGTGDIVKRADRCRDGFGLRINFQGDFSDDAQRAFTTDEQTRQVVTGR